MSVKAVDYLKELLGDFVGFPRLVVVAGHPGSGKTSLASTICLYALEKNEKCLYISFQEDRNRLYSQLEGIGINFRKYDEEGLLRFVKMPVVSPEEDMHPVLDTISKLVLDFNPRIVVVDSVTPLLENVKDRVTARAYLQNFFWELQKIISGTVVLISEIPIGEEYVSIGWIEFVADAVLILKHYVKGSLIERIMEIRKIRGRKLTVAEVRFTIQNGKGIIIHRPIVLEEFKAPLKRRVIAIHRGRDVEVSEIVSPPLYTYIEYPPGLTSWLPIAYSLLIRLVDRNTKILFISYNYSETELKYFLSQVLERYGVDNETINKILNKIIFISTNPAAYTLHELSSYLLSIVDEVKPDTLYMFNISTAWLTMKEDPRDYAMKLYNFIFEVRSKGIDIVRIGCFVDPVFSNMNKNLATHSIIIMCIDQICSDYVIHVTTPSGVSKLSWREFEEATRKLIEIVKEVYSKT